MQNHRSEYEQEAYELGKQDAANVASWTCVAHDFIPRLLAMMEDGDPRADDYLPARPSLSGEWADGMTPWTLTLKVGADPEQVGYEGMDAIAAAYEQGVSDHFEQACERELRRWIEG